jgi:serine/threonine protein kinase
VETGRVIHGRYLLQRLIKQTAFCHIHQGMDQRLQRAVAVKSVSASTIVAYRTAVKMTANFSHQHIIGLYDVIIEPDALYVVQEYVDGDTFATLVQSQLSPFEIAEAGWQICLALMYAGSASRRVCHGDLTPASLIRDGQGIVRVNNFALPTDMAYFEKWSVLGSEGVPLLETEMPWGQQSEARRADDTRAVGLLLYQLLAGSLEPPADGRLRFARGIPPELCETVARAVVRQHPQNINTPEVLHAHLKALAETLEPAPPTPVQEEPLVRQFSSAGVGKAGASLPPWAGERGGRSLSSYSGQLPTLDASPSTSAAANLPFNQANQHTDYPTPLVTKNTSPTLMILLLGLLAFGLFFIVGYFLGHMLIP